MADTVKLEVRLVPDTKELEKVLKQYQGKKIQVESTLPKEYHSKGGTGLLGSLSSFKSLMPIAAMTAGIMAVKKVLDKINESITKIKEDMSEINPAYGKTEELMKKMYNMALLPMSQLMTMMLKPYLQYMIIKLKEARKKAEPWLEQYKTGNEAQKKEAIDKLMEIFKESAEDMAWTQFSFRVETGKIAAAMAGYRKGLEIIWNNWTTSAGDWASGFIEGLSAITTSGEAAKRNAQGFAEAVETGKIKVEELTPKLSSMVTEFEKTKKTITDPKKGLNAIGTDIVNVASDFSDNFRKALQKVLDGIKSKEYHLRRQANLIEQAYTAVTGEKVYPSWAGINENANVTSKQQDFIIRGNNVIPFSKDDTVIGMKDIGNMGGTTNITINVTQDGEDIARQIKRELYYVVDKYGRF